MADDRIEIDTEIRHVTNGAGFSDDVSILRLDFAGREDSDFRPSHR